MIQLSGVSKSYLEKSRGPIRALDEIDLEVKKGEFLYVVGGSGAGKSSLLRLIATEEVSSSGSVSLFGYNVVSATPSTLCAIRRSIGYIPQNIRLISDFTVYDNVMLSISLARHAVIRAEAENRVMELLERLGLAPKRYHLARTLSGGEAQRVAVARALVRLPEIIIADEPTGAQDKDFVWTVMDLFHKANQTGATLIVATHDREIVRRVRRKSIVLKSGKTAAEEGLCFY